MLTLRTRKDLLIREFEQINANHDDFISRDELYRYLDSKCQFQFDRNVADQLYERMDKDYDGRVTLAEFVNVYLEAEELLTNKIENTRLGIQDCITQKREASLKREDAIRMERLNSYGIMEGSTLNLTIVQAQNLKFDEVAYNQMKTYVVCNCGSQKFQTNISESFNPIWSESFTIPITTGNETLQLMVLDYDMESRDEILGIVNLNLQFLKDQAKHDEWFELISNKGIKTNGKILLSLQWICSYVAYYTDIVKAFDENLKTLQEDLLSYEGDLASLYEPFGNLMTAYQNQADLKQSNVSNVKTIAHVSFVAQGKTDNLTMGLFCFYLLLTLMVFWGRACFLDILMVSSFFFFLYFNILSTTNYSYLAFVMLFSLIIDLSWLIIYTDGYWNGSENVLADISENVYLNRYVVMMSYFTFFLKIGIIVWLAVKRHFDVKLIMLWAMK